tara:strand:+ start:3277 stop:3753 length:477 start_codon:yes stop_codon:yes gene_type:complete
MIYDSLVIGGGIAGASAAYELAAQGSVLLLEAESTAGYHATGRSAALFTRNYGGPVVRQVNAASAGFFQSPPPGFCDTPLLAPRGCLTIAIPDHEAEFDALLALSEPGEEIRPIDPSDACDMAPVLAKLTADLCTATPWLRTDPFAQALSPERLRGRQ